jgi:hypothetical protein
VKLVPQSQIFVENLGIFMIRRSFTAESTQVDVAQLFVLRVISAGDKIVLAEEQKTKETSRENIAGNF